MDYERARRLVLLTGLVILLLVATVMFVRRVDPVEVVATLLFLPIFAAVLIWGARGGIAAGLVAALAYAALRWPAIQAVGAGRFAGLIAMRSIGYVAFGAIGGWSLQQLRASITKLELYDQIDDATKLHNSRAIVETLDRERSRADRYHEIVSVVIARVTGLEGKRRSGTLAELGQMIEAGKRTVDSAMHATQGPVDLFVVVLPETGASGANTFATKLGNLVTAVGGANLNVDVTTITYPDQPDELAGFLDEARRIVASDFPAPAAHST